MTLPPSAVVQPLPMLAVNISGKEACRLVMSALADRFLEPAATVMGAQFIYISRLPIRLNHVHARTYSPGLMPSGMVY